ncbi:MAG: hypothetical protein HQK65_14510, partial [Desulfamplus sp.]|nr:hypothetical protein [Desulfamplus sp.]
RDDSTGSGWPFGEEVAKEDIQRYLETKKEDIGELNIETVEYVGQGKLKEHQLPELGEIIWKDNNASHGE